MEKRTLLRPSPVDVPSAKLQSIVWLDPTCGIRCLACIGVVVFHIAWYVGRAAEDKHAIDGALAQHLWFTILYNPEPALQAFMCLTGFLAAVSLVPGLELTQSYIQTVLRYYKKRALRIMPAYYTMLLVIRIIVSLVDESSGLAPHVWAGFFGPLGAFDRDQCTGAMGYNVFFAQNQLPAFGCFTVAWSLAVQMQFWFVFPLVLLLLRPHTPGFRKRAAQTFLGTIAAVLAYRAWQLKATRLWEHMPLQLFDPPDVEHSKLLTFLGKHEYFGTFSRLCPLCWGALTALVVLNADCSRIVSGHRRKVEGAWALLMCTNFIGCAVNMVGPHTDPANPLSNPVRLTFAYLFIQGVWSPLLPATTLVLTTTRRPADAASTLLAKLLGSTAFTWLADITYDIYLTHTLVFLGIWYMLPPSLWFAPDQPQAFALVSCLILGVCIITAWVHNRCWGKLLGNLNTTYQGKPVQSAN